MDFAPEEDFYSQRSSTPGFIRLLSQRYQSLLDASTPHTIGRWVFAISLLVFFMFRVVFKEGWYIVAYALGIYFLNLLIAFLTPKIDPAMNFDDDGPSLPTANDEEFRPFIRRLAEFKFWHSVCVSTLISIICTFFDFLNVPVFWPILLLYFITLFCITMKRQIMHMIRYRYLPWTRGKTKYSGREDTGRVYYNNESYVPLIPNNNNNNVSPSPPPQQQASDPLSSASPTNFVSHPPPLDSFNG